MVRILGGLGCALALAGCSGWLSGMNLAGAPQTVSAEVRLESYPTGAEARTSLGSACRTPCVLRISTAGDFNVGFVLDGFLPQTIAVRVKPPGNPQLDPSASETAVLDPNPVVAELHPEPVPRRQGRGR